MFHKSLCISYYASLIRKYIFRIFLAPYREGKMCHPEFFHFFFCNETTKVGPGHVGLKVSRPHAIWYTPGRTPLKERSARRRDNYGHNTLQTQETNILAPNGFRTRDPSNQLTADLRVRPHGHRRFFLNYLKEVCTSLGSKFYKWYRNWLTKLPGS